MTNRKQRWRSAGLNILGVLAVLVLLTGCSDGGRGNTTLFYDESGRLGVPLWSPDGRWVVAEEMTTPGERLILRATGELTTRLDTPCEGCN